MNDEAAGDRNRDSLLLLVKVSAQGKSWTAKVRNISAGGVMAEPCGTLAPGDAIEIELRHIGQVGGKVAWVDGPRFGVAFDRTIDHQAVRASIQSTTTTTSSSTDFGLPIRRI